MIVRNLHDLSNVEVLGTFFYSHDTLCRYLYKVSCASIFHDLTSIVETTRISWGAQSISMLLILGSVFHFIVISDLTCTWPSLSKIQRYKVKMY